MNRLKVGRPSSVEVVGPRFRYYHFVICWLVFWIGLHNLSSVGKVVPPLALFAGTYYRALVETPFASMARHWSI